MDFQHRFIGGVSIEASAFFKNRVDERHFYVKGAKGAPFTDQTVQVEDGIRDYLQDQSFPEASVVFVRLFTSDIANQEAELARLKAGLVEQYAGCAVSIVEQPPLEGCKLVAWVYAIKDAKKKALAKESDSTTDSLVMQRNGYRHLWTTQLKSSSKNPDSACQTRDIFSSLGTTLEGRGLTVKDNCLRTWLFVKDIDYNYQGVVDARKKYFAAIGMTEDTHYIASTGIGGRVGAPATNVLMDAYSIGGIENGQVRYLAAPEYLNPTHEYGVTFERGTSLDFGDRRHIYISGTASIDKEGEVVHNGDVYKQTQRTFTNINALLEDAGADLSDVAQMVVYLRDVNDTATVQEFFAKNHWQIPKVLVLAPVCRPGWLIEIECLAIKDITRPEFADF